MARVRNGLAIGTAVGALVALLVLGGCPNQLMESLEKMVSEATTTPHLALKCLDTSTVIQDNDTYSCSALLGKSNVLEFELKNSGDRDLIVDLIEIVPGSGDVGDFSLAAGALPLAVTPGSTNTFEVTFEPATIGSKQVEVRILHNGPEGGGDFRFTLEGSAVSTDATLSNLEVSEGTLSPPFSSGTLAYTVDVLHTVQSIRVTPTASSADATVTVEGTAVASGSTSAQIDLNYGGNDIEVDVTAGGGGGTLGYTIRVTRDDPPSTNCFLSSLEVSSGTLVPSFGKTENNYACSVPYEVGSIGITAQTEDDEATLTIDGFSTDSGATRNISLSPGSNLCTIHVTAESGVDYKDYKITITRRAEVSLSALTVKAAYDEDTLEKDEVIITIQPKLEPLTYHYYGRANAATVKLRITPVAAGSITVNGGAYVQPFTAVTGRNDFTILVQAGSGATADTRTYELSVYVPWINLAVTGQQTSYRTGDDGDLRCGLDWRAMSIERFFDTNASGDITVDDNFTNLIWAGNLKKTDNWANALSYAGSKSFAGKDDWRLPNVHELESLLNYHLDTATWLESAGFLDIENGDYWTSTTCPTLTTSAYVVNPSRGTISAAGKTSSHNVLLVRDSD